MSTVLFCRHGCH